MGFEAYCGVGVVSRECEAVWSQQGSGLLSWVSASGHRRQNSTNCRND